jgi:hypothetical protein
MMTPSTKSLSDRRSWTVLPMIFALLCATNFFAADSAPQVIFETQKATPRAVEPLTQRSIVRDYKLAWTNLSLALDSNSTGPLNGLFSGTANDRLLDAVKGQQKSGISTRYSNQNHKLEAVFYAQEGDVIELHDTAECDIQISDGSKTIHSEHAVVHYVVLMTPAADRWVIRQLQAVPQF